MYRFASGSTKLSSLKPREKTEKLAERLLDKCRRDVFNLNAESELSDNRPHPFCNRDWGLLKWQTCDDAQNNAVDVGSVLHYLSDVSDCRNQESVKQQKLGDLRTLLDWLVSTHATDIINARNCLYQTPLHVAVESGNVDGAALLLQYGADDRLKDCSNRLAKDYRFSANNLKSVVSFWFPMAACYVPAPLVI